MFFTGVLGLFAQGSYAQGSQLIPPAGPTPVQPNLGTSVQANLGKTKPEPPAHKFWDEENIGLFAGVGAARMLDYASTLHMRHEGHNEVLLSNWIVDNRPLFTGIELGGTATSIGVSWIFHRTGHHALERWVSIVNIGVGVGGSIRNYGLQPVRPVFAEPVQ